jgi:hypothetical protein
MKLVNHIDDNKSINRTDTSRDFKTGSCLGWKSFTKSEDLLDSVHGFLVQDALTIVFQIKIEGNQRINDCRLYHKCREGIVI